VSTAPGLDRVAARPAPRRRPPLALVPPRRPAPAPAVLGRNPFVALVVALLAAGLLGLLVLNTALAQDAFRLHTLKQESRALEDREEALLREVEALRAPQELAARATALGMVQAGPPAFLRLSDGAVLGADTPAEVPELAPGAVDPDVPADAAPEVAAAEEAADEEAAEDVAAQTGTDVEPTQPTDEAQPSDEAQPTETQPTETQPTETQPTETQPTDEADAEAGQ
jgi:hypothetical protein